MRMARPVTNCWSLKANRNWLNTPVRNPARPPAPGVLYASGTICAAATESAGEAWVGCLHPPCHHFAARDITFSSNLVNSFASRVRLRYAVTIEAILIQAEEQNATRT